jgi:6-phosphogluconolactonase
MQLHFLGFRGWLRISVWMVTLAAAGCVGLRAEECQIYFGTYTGKSSKGIYTARFDTTTGKVGDVDLAAETPSPSFLAIHPSQKYLYAANEVSQYEGKPTGSVTAFSIDPKSGRLTQIDQESSGGLGPCYVAVDRRGKALLVANYGGGSVAGLPIGKDGSLSPASAFVQHTGSSINASRQKEPHAHSINVDPGNRFAVAADLGLDKLLIYRFNANAATLTPNAPPFAMVRPGSGPRHLAFHPDGKHAYVINEITCTVTVFRFVPRKGEMIEEQTISTLPKDEPMMPAYSTAEIRVHPSGKFLYGSNRGHDTIAVFRIDSAVEN